MTLYQVGGCVRDKLLGMTPADVDYVYVSSGITIEAAYHEMREYLIFHGYTIFLETPSCFTIRAKLRGEVVDFVLARKEEYTKDSRTPICSPGSLYDDLLRRDFTVNAIALSETGEFIDYFHGREDLEARILRTPRPTIQTFQEDPLRMIRALRFSITHGFTMADDVRKAMTDSGILEKLHRTVSIERIRDELYKCFSYDTGRTLKHLTEFPSLTDILFKQEMLWLKPTTEKPRRIKMIHLA